jgi:hypothetical protein
MFIGQILLFETQEMKMPKGSRRVSHLWEQYRRPANLGFPKLNKGDPLQETRRNILHQHLHQRVGGAKDSLQQPLLQWHRIKELIDDHLSSVGDQAEGESTLSGKTPTMRTHLLEMTAQPRIIVGIFL